MADELRPNDASPPQYRAMDAETAATWRYGLLGRNRKRALLAAVQVVSTAVLTPLAVLGAYLMYHSWPPSMGAKIERTPLTILPLLYRAARAPEFAPYLPLLALAPLAYVAVFYLLGLYRPATDRVAPFAQTTTVLKGTLLGTLLLLAFGFIYGHAPGAVRAHFSALFFIYHAMLVFLGMLLMHSGALLFMLLARYFGLGLTRVAVVGADLRSANLRDMLQEPAAPYRFVGCISTGVETGANTAEPDRLGPLDTLPALVNEHDIDEVVLATDPSNLSTDQRLELAQTCWKLGVELKMVPPFYPFFHTSARPEMLGDIPLLRIERVGLYATWPQILKRAMDIAVSLVALTAAAPVMLLAALAIKLDSPGPVLFVQKRVGLNGRLFRIFKFRSMRTDADAAAHREYLEKLIKEAKAHGADANGKPIYKMDGDARITRVGKFIRKTSIDELPQLFNVLRGEMSLVGPRPELPYALEHYSQWHTRRLLIRPGITGLWQVSGRSRLSYEQMVQLDIKYIEEWSLLSDIRILLRTIPVVLKIGQSY